MSKLFTAFFVAVFAMMGSWYTPETNNNSAPITADMPVSQVLKSLGVSKDVPTEEYTAEEIQRGYEIVNEGQTTSPKGKLSARQSKFFTCNHCHNMVKEDPDLANPHPESRLEFAVQNDLPFLQGTTMYGVANRGSWYNGDYYKKYGEAVYAAQDDLKEAVQLCAKECAQGRTLKNWELRYVMAYLWSIELKMGDLALTNKEIAQLEAARSGDKKEMAAAASMLTSKYTASPATFGDAYQSQQAAFKLEGDKDNGKNIYERSCKHCHAPETGVTHFIIDDEPTTFQMLDRRSDGFTRYSLYQISRYGTKPVLGYKPYMPHYTMERMSDQQMADLHAYIKSMK